MPERWRRLRAWWRGEGREAVLIPLAVLLSLAFLHMVTRS